MLPPSRAEFSLKRLSYFSGPALSAKELFRNAGGLAIHSVSSKSLRG